MRILRGLGALIILVCLLVGLPAGLATFGTLDGLPAPAEIWDALSRPDDGTLLISILTVVGWAGWGSFALGVLVEIPAQLRRVPAPRLPAGLGLPQAGARVLVAAVIGMVTLAGTAGTTATAAPDVIEPGDTLSSIAHEHLGDSNAWPAIAEANPDVIEDPNLIHPGTTLEIPDRPDPSPGDEDEEGDEASTVTVQEGDTLSSIAHDHLGDSNAWPAIAEANPDVIEDPDLIYPGEVLDIPGAEQAPTTAAPHDDAPPVDDASGVGEESSQAGANLGADSEIETQTEQAAPDTLAADTVQEHADPPPESVPDSSPAQDPSQLAPAAALTATEDTTTTAADADSGLLDVRTLGIGACSAAGVLLLLAARRAAQSRRRRPGRRIAMPAGAAAEIEPQLRQGSDALAVAHLDQALRTIAGWAHETQTQMPAVRGALITPGEIEIYLTADDATLPSPFTAADDPGTWTLTREGAEDLLTPEQAQTIPAPCPSLVTIGHDDRDGWVLLNLEEIGALGIAGDPQACEGALAALTLELIGSAWADDLRVTLVGVLPELADALGSDRVEYAPSLDRVLPGVAYASDVHALTLASAQQPSVTAARGAMVATETWTPHLLVLASDPSPEERELLEEVLARTPRLAVATITTGTTPLSPWVLHHTQAGGRLYPPGIDLTPQLISGPDYTALIEAFTTTDAEDTDGPAWAQTLTGEVALAHLPQPQPAGENLDGEGGEPGPVDEPPTVTTGDPAGIPTLLTGAPLEPPTPEDEQQTTLDEEDSDLPAPSEEDPAELPATAGDAGVATTAGQDAVDTSETVSEAADAPESDDEGSGGVIHPLRRPGPLVRLLGAVEIQRAEGKRPQSPGRGTELIAFLAMHPSDSHPPMDAAMWPGQRVDAKRRNPIVTQCRKWLGNAEDGKPRLSYADDGGYRLHEDVMIDWHELNRIVGDDISTVATEDLVTALRMVDGQPLSGVSPHYYGWAEVDRQEMIQSIADIAHEVAARSLSAGDPRTAAWAAAKGTMVAPESEQLWRDQLRAAWLSAIPGRIRDIAQQMTNTLEPIGGDMEPETIELLEQLMTDSAPGGRVHA